LRPPIAGNNAPPDERQQLEADYTFKRVVELELDPVRGNFDAAHLKEINRRIFQDLPGAGFDDVTPGEFRPLVSEGKDWMKNRGLSTVDGPFYVAYSRMDEKAQQRLDKALEGADPDKLRDLKTAEFTVRMGALYAELDYTHPFSDGNSRTLRTFTKQLAKEAGYDLDWTRFNQNDAGRDVLYIARDRSVNELAKPHIEHEQSMRKIVITLDRLEGNRDLPSLLRDAIRPSRAVAFEKSAEVDALKEYPNLEEAFKTMRSASQYFETKIPGDATAQQNALQTVRKHVQDRLNEGETSGFRPSSSQQQKARSAPTKTVDAERDSRDVDRER
jgi:cell filamentation protein